MKKYLDILFDHMLRFYFKGLIVVAITASLFGCKKFIEVPSPSTSLNAGNVYQDNTSAAGVMTAEWAKMSARFLTGNLTSLSLFDELSADNMNLFDQNRAYLMQHYQNQIDPAYTINEGFNTLWTNAYAHIYVANAVIEGAGASDKLSAQLKNTCLGEAYFLRAFAFFYLINHYGDVPLTLTTDFERNALMARTPIAEVYQQIVADLKQAKELLGISYVDATLVKTTTERVRPNKFAASALLARVYLYTGAWALAESESSFVIAQGGYVPAGLSAAFLRNSSDTIWALQPVKANFNTDEGAFFIPTTSGFNAANPVYLSPNLMGSFESGDLRRSSWTTTITQAGNSYAYANKYKVRSSATITEYPIVLRISEQYLIRAEARTEQNNISGAQQDINLVRSRAGLPATTASDQVTLKSAILRERRSEFFAEWGHRWMDLKRTGNINSVMTAIAPSKGSSWKSYKALYPIPVADILKNPNLVQNQGYTP